MTAVLATFSSRLEAEAVGHALERFGIPWTVRADDVGMFGPGMVGWSPQGAALVVPQERLAEAQELLSCFAPEEGGEEPAPG